MKGSLLRTVWDPPRWPCTGSRRGGLLLARTVLAALSVLVPCLSWTWLSIAVVHRDIEIGGWTWLLLLPGLGVELAATLWLDARPRNKTAHVFRMVGAVTRLSFLVLFFWALVGRTVDQLGTPDISATLIGYWFHVTRAMVIANPLPGLPGAALVLAAVGLASARGRLRFTTTVLLPGGLALGMFLLFYYLPLSPLRMGSRPPDEGVRKVFPPDPSPDTPEDLRPPFYPRDLLVDSDRQRVVASYGSSFAFGSGAGSQVSLRGFAADGTPAWSYRSPVVRRFQSHCPGPAFVAPWHLAKLLEVDPATGPVATHDLPRESRGEPVEEINQVLPDCDSGRVYIANSRNPVLYVWNFRDSRLERTLDLVGLFPQIEMGESVAALGINPALHRLYVLTVSKWNILEFDSDDLRPTRVLQLDAPPLDVAVSPDGEFLYLSGFLTGKVWKVAARTLSVEATFDAPPVCRRLEITGDGRTLLLASYLTGELIAMDPVTGRVRRRVYVAPKTEGLFLTDRDAWVSTAAGVYRVPLDALSE